MYGEAWQADSGAGVTGLLWVWPDLCECPKKIQDPGFAESKVWDLDGSWTLHVLFVVGLWKPRTSKLGSDMPQDPGNPGPQNFDHSETLETQDLKVLIVARPWKPRTLKFEYVWKPWKPRTQNLKIMMS